jgi:RNAse (barnase) inhibitor barstar
MFASQNMNRPTLEIDGAQFNDLEGFWRHVSERLIPGSDWGQNLDAFNDILRGGFGTPEGDFRLKWLNSDRSRQVLGMAETIRFLEQKLERCHPSNIDSVKSDIEAARRSEGQTLFDMLVDILRAHGEEGAESGDGIELILA